MSFFRWLEFNPLPSDAQALWHTLIYINNGCAINVDGAWHWRVEFTVSNTKLLSMLGFSRPQLDRMRNVLIQSGRIVYRKGKGNRAGTYTIIPFGVHYVTQTVIQAVTQTEIQTVTQMETQTGHNQSTLVNINNKYSLGVDDDAREAFSDSIVESYLEDRTLLLEVYNNVTAETQQQLAALSQSIFKRFAGRAPTDLDLFEVFRYTYASVGSGDRTVIEFPKPKVDLLLYAFEQAHSAGCPANWKYIDGVMCNLRKRGITTVEQAEKHDVDRVFHNP